MVQAELHILNAMPPQSFSSPGNGAEKGSPASPKGAGITRNLKKVLSGWREGAAADSSLQPIPSEDADDLQSPAVSHASVEACFDTCKKQNATPLSPKNWDPWLDMLDVEK